MFGVGSFGGWVRGLAFGRNFLRPGTREAEVGSKGIRQDQMVFELEVASIDRFRSIGGECRKLGVFIDPDALISRVDLGGLGALNEEFVSSIAGFFWVG